MSETTKTVDFDFFDARLQADASMTYVIRVNSNQRTIRLADDLRFVVSRVDHDNHIIAGEMQTLRDTLKVMPVVLRAGVVVGLPNQGLFLTVLLVDKNTVHLTVIRADRAFKAVLGEPVKADGKKPAEPAKPTEKQAQPAHDVDFHDARKQAIYAQAYVLRTDRARSSIRLTDTDRVQFSHNTGRDSAFVIHDTLDGNKVVTSKGIVIEPGDYIDVSDSNLGVGCSEIGENRVELVVLKADVYGVATANKQPAPTPTNPSSQFDEERMSFLQERYLTACEKFIKYSLKLDTLISQMGHEPMLRVSDCLRPGIAYLKDAVAVARNVSRGDAASGVQQALEVLQKSQTTESGSQSLGSVVTAPKYNLVGTAYDLKQKKGHYTIPLGGGLQFRYITSQYTEKDGPSRWVVNAAVETVDNNHLLTKYSGIDVGNVLPFYSQGVLLVCAHVDAYSACFVLIKANFIPGCTLSQPA